MILPCGCGNKSNLVKQLGVVSTCPERKHCRIVPLGKKEMTTQRPVGEIVV